MIFTEQKIGGVWTIDLEPIADERGLFARTWCAAEFEARGLCADVAQCSISFNSKAGTVRGMHYQTSPHAETKLVRCTRGAVHDAVIDLRPDSPTYKQHVAIELTAENRRALYIPPGLAHGFQTLRGDTEIHYQMNVPFAPGYACGVRWNDPAFGLNWPLPVSVISEKDRGYADYLG